MKFKSNIFFKYRKIRKCQKANILRKLDMKVTCNAKEQVDTEYDIENSQPRCLPRRTKEHFIYNGTFHEAIGKVLLMAEIFAVMPVRGVTAPHPRDLSFAWTNVRTWYSIFFICTATIDMSLSIYKILSGPITFNTIEPMIFRCCVLFACISSLNLARKWPKLMLYWHEVESGLPQYYTQTEKRRMAHKIHMVVFAGMMLSMAEHLLNVISIIYYSSFCHKTNDPIKNYFLIATEEVFYVFSYSSILGVCGKIQSIFGTFVWNYMDIFIMVVSIGLTAQFRKLCDNLLKFKGMHMTASFWAERRLQYRNICTLCDKIDDAISLITMISFSNNLYFICVQLLRSLNKMPSVVHAVYFYFSLIFLIVRTLAVSLYSASINDESRRPLRYLRCVPKESWCPEVKRFAEEISSDLIALSGMKFFHLTRKLVLSVAGTIVTYELVLIQFHEDTDLWDCAHTYFA